MKIGKLIDWLQQFDEDTDVYIAQPSHNYWGDVVAAKIADIDLADITYSDYHRAMQVVTNKDTDVEEDDIKEVVLLS
jgi:hypothetical protein